MLTAWLHHCLYIGIGVAAALLLGILSDRRRGLAVGRSLRARLSWAVPILGVLATWALLPAGWHLLVGVVTGVVCVGWLWWEALRSLRPGGVSGPSGTGGSSSDAM